MSPGCRSGLAEEGFLLEALPPSALCEAGFRWPTRAMWVGAGALKGQALHLGFLPCHRQLQSKARTMWGAISSVFKEGGGWLVPWVGGVKGGVGKEWGEREREPGKALGVPKVMWLCASSRE